MKNTISTIRQLGASVFSKRTSAPLAERRISPKPAAELSPAEAAAVIEEFLLESHRLVASLNTSAVLAAHGATLAEWAILKEFHSSPTPLLAAARRLRLSRHGLRRQLERLEKKGLIRMTQIGAADQQKSGFEVTPQGKALLQEFSKGLGSVSAGSGAGYRRAARIARLLQRSLRKSEAPSS